MSRRIQWFVVLTCAALLFSIRIQFILADHASSTTSLTTSSLIPLPSRCGIGLPPNQGGAVCCMFGYVLIDGVAVRGAKVTITSANGSAEVWTEQGDDSAQPYYRVNLSAPPLDVHVGNTITLTAEYSGHLHSMSYTPWAGGQQVDVVLGRNQASDFVFDRQIWQQAQAGQFNLPADIAIDTTGTIYVVDRDNARVQVFNNNRQFIRQWGTIGAQPGQFMQPVGIAIDQLSNVYIADNENHRIQKFSSTGTWLGNIGGPGNGDGQLRFPRGVAIDSNGDIYVADTFNHRIQKFSSDGTYITQWGNWGSNDGQFNEVNDLAIDANDNVYVVDTANYRIQKFNSTGGFITKWGTRGNGDAQFEVPRGISIGADGNVYVVDTNNHRVQKFTSNGDFVKRWGGFGSDNSTFHTPRGIYVDTNIYVADTFNYRIQEFTTDGTFINKWGTRGSDSGQFDDPKGIAIDHLGNLYVADTRNHRIQKFASDDTFVTDWGSNGSQTGQFSSPRGLAIDRFGNVYVADTENSRIQKFNSNGGLVTSWGVRGDASGDFKNPWSIAVSHDNYVYVADTNNMRVQKFDLDGNFILKWGSYGNANGQFYFPQGITTDHIGNVYVVDTRNHRVQKFTANGDYITQWGTRGSANGQFELPQNAVVDAQGYIYISDDQNNRIQKFTSDGIWVANIGTRGSQNGQFEGPHGLALNQSGSLYVSDTVHDRIQVLRPMVFELPLATIIATGPRDVAQGETIDLYGMGRDSDDTPDLDAYEWTLDGSSTPFATTPIATLSTSQLAVGEHTLTFRVRDTEGFYSAAQSLSITVGPSINPPVETWTFLLYLDGDNSDIAPYLNRNSPLGALYRLEHSPIKANVQVLALYDGPRVGNSDSFYYVQQQNGQFRVEQVSERNMGDPQTLIDFVRWGKLQAPADHYYLAIADHANGLEGIAWDATSGMNERLTIAELRLALAEITDNGAQPIDVLHLDGCLMGLMESSYQARGMAHYVIASENLAWSIFDYSTYRSTIGNVTTPRDLATAIVNTYAERIRSEAYPYTIAALDVSQTNQLIIKTDTFAKELARFALTSTTNRTTLQNVRKSVQKLDSNGTMTITEEDDYIDFIHLAQLAQSRIPDSAVQAAAAEVQAIFSTFLVHERHSSGSYINIPVNLDHAKGIGIYYPSHHSARTYNSYVQELSFTNDTHWDEFLAAALATSTFEPTEPAPAPVAPLPINPRTYVPIVSS